jgi:beta-lactamase class A
VEIGGLFGKIRGMNGLRWLLGLICLWALAACAADADAPLVAEVVETATATAQRAVPPTIQPTPSNPTPQPTPTPTPFTPPDIHYLQAAVEAALADFGGVSSYLIMDLTSGEQISRNADVAIAGSSLIKLALLIETFRVLERPPDIEQTKLLTQTTTVSSNFAANLLLRDVVGSGDIFAGADRLTESMRRLGLFNTFITVPYDMEPPDGRLQTYLTPANQRQDITTRPDPFRQSTIADLAALAEMIYWCAEGENGRLRQTYPDTITQAECQTMLDLLSENNLARLLERGLPDDVPIAHKVGWIDDTHGNVALVFGPERNYLVAMALYEPGWLEWERSAPLFEAVSRLAYAHFNRPDAYPPEVLAQPPDVPPTPTPAPTPAYPQAIVFGTRGVGLTLRVAPGGAEIAVLPEGTVVSLLDAPPQSHAGLTWRKIAAPDGAEGWVGEMFLTFGD